MGGTGTTPEWLDLHADEQLLVQATPSSNLVLASMIVGVALMLLMSIVVGFVTTLATGRLVSFVVLVFIVVLIAAAFLLTKRREYVVTTQRVCVATGLTEKNVVEYPLHEVRDVIVTQPGWQQVFNVGTLRFSTADGEAVSFALVENPVSLQGQVLQFIDSVAET